VPPEAAIETSVTVIEETKAEENIVLPHLKAASTTKQVGFNMGEEEIKSLSSTSSEYLSLDAAIHKSEKFRAGQRDTKAGVRLLFFYISLMKYILSIKHPFMF
jgi:hypothetical protein